MITRLAVPPSLKRWLKSWWVLSAALGFAVGVLTIVLGVAGEASPDTTKIGVMTLPLPLLCKGGSAPEQSGIASRLVVKAFFSKEADQDQALAGHRLPVVFFNAGWAGTSDLHMNLINELVIRGFAVVSVDHRLDLNEYDQFVDFSSDEGFQRSRPLVDQKTDRFARDNSDVLNALQAASLCAEPDAAGVFLQRLDFDRLGILGYSFGGAVAAQTGWRDPRFKAVLNLDGWMFADAFVQGVKQPFMEISDGSALPTASDLVSSDTPHRLNAKLNEADYAQLKANMMANGGYYLAVIGSNHHSFVDVSKRSALQRAVALLPGSRRISEAIRAYVGAFFDHYVAGKTSDLIGQIPSPYKEVRMELAKPPTAAH